MEESKPSPLTPRQHQILTAIRSGASNKIIAHRLQITEGTVKKHITDLLARLKVSNRTAAAMLDI